MLVEGVMDIAAPSGGLKEFCRQIGVNILCKGVNIKISLFTARNQQP